MPRISAFYGIMIYMYYKDHAPPHFHAIYGEYEAEVLIQTGQILRGFLPSRARSLVVQWATMHGEELLDDWNLARNGELLRPVEPLE